MIHILGFITLKFLPMCVTIIAALAIFQPWIWVVMDPGKFLIDLGGKNMFHTKITLSRSKLTSGRLSVRYIAVTY